MDGTLKIGHYKVGGTQKTLSFTETQYFFEKNNENTFLCI
jgi:hypothetical protein